MVAGFHLRRVARDEGLHAEGLECRSEALVHRKGRVQEESLAPS